jgi:hypothetical protein
MSLISSMRSSRLKLSRFNQAEEDDRSASERVNELILNQGDVYILPYLDVYDKDKFGAGKSLL